MTRKGKSKAENSVVRVEVWFQYNGDLASEIQKTPSGAKRASAARYLEECKLHMTALGLGELAPNTSEVVWGTGQVRCSWSLVRYSVRATQCSLSSFPL